MNKENNKNITIRLIVVDPSKEEHLVENALLKRFIQQFEIDKKQQLPDLDQVLLLHTEKTVKDIHRNGKHLWFIDCELGVIGYTTVLWQVWPVKKSVFISDFFIEKKYRRYGYGQIALNMIIKKLFEQYPDAERVGLSVFSSNTIAKSLYSKLGFSSKLETMVLEKTHKSI